MRASLVVVLLSVGCSGSLAGGAPEEDQTTDSEVVDARIGDDAAAVDDAVADDAATDTIVLADDAPKPAPDAVTDVAPPPSAKKKVLDFFAANAGKRTLSGIHNRHNAMPSQYTGQMHDITGKYPAFWSADFLFEPGDIAKRQAIVDQAKVEWTHGAVVQLMFHACPPDVGEPCNWDPGLLHHPLSDAQWSDLVTSGGKLNLAWKARLDLIAKYLKQLQDAGVAPLFRPIHEMNQGAFWWGGRPGATGTRKLYQLTHDYLVKDKGLDQLIWVWDVQDLSWDFASYDPGEAYYDIAALDVYDGSGYTQAKYDAMKKVSPTRPIAIGECQQLPTSDVLTKQPAWAFFMGWSELVAENNGAASIKNLFLASNVVTLDEMPGWIASGK